MRMKVPKGDFGSDAVEESFLFPKVPLCEEFLKESFVSSFEEYFNNTLKRLFSVINNILCNDKKGTIMEPSMPIKNLNF